MPYVDKTLVCRECGSNFNFSAGEQAFYASRGLTNEPTRCSPCRGARKSGGALGTGYVHYGPFASFGGRNPKQMHPAVCASCNQMTEVPFLPRSGRPVYCSDCYSNGQRQAAG